MANTYAANFGDVIKHAVLCEVVKAENPGRYIESHGGRLQYDLGGLDPGPGGVWDFLTYAAHSGSLAGSAYTELVTSTCGSVDTPGVYLGSIAIADALLRPGAEVIAFEFVESSADSLRSGLSARGRPATVTVSDGLAGVCEISREGDLVLIDPFEVHARDGSLSAAEAFAAVAKRNVAVLLWYAIYEPTDSSAWVDDVTSDLSWHRRVVGGSSIGGLAGCGFVGANLSPASVAAATTIIDDLAAALAPVRPGLRVD